MAVVLNFVPFLSWELYLCINRKVTFLFNFKFSSSKLWFPLAVPSPSALIFLHNSTQWCYGGRWRVVMVGTICNPPAHSHHEEESVSWRSSGRAIWWADRATLPFPKCYKEVALWGDLTLGLDDKISLLRTQQWKYKVSAQNPVQYNLLKPLSY